MTQALSLVTRTPQVGSSPVLTEVDQIVGPWGFKLTETLNRPEMLEFSMAPGKQADAIKSLLLDLTAQGLEVWARDEDEVLFAGPLLGYSPGLQEGEKVWTMTSAGLWHYSYRMHVEPGDTQVFSGVDQAFIAQALINYYQALDYGHYGIDTSGVVATGVTRDRTYEGIEIHQIGQRIEELAEVNNGFDFWVDPATRAFTVGSPARGTDLTESVIIDGRSMVDPSGQISVAAQDIASEGYGVSDELLAHQTNATLRQNWGRCGYAESFDGITNQGTLNDHAQRLIDDRDKQYHAPPESLYPIAFDWADFGLGDLVEYAYDYGAGTLVEQRRVSTRELQIDQEGIRTIRVGVM